jgi:hypothetical protein
MVPYTMFLFEYSLLMAPGSPPPPQTRPLVLLPLYLQYWVYQQKNAHNWSKSPSVNSWSKDCIPEAEYKKKNIHWKDNFSPEKSDFRAEMVPIRIRPHDLLIITYTTGYPVRK